MKISDILAAFNSFTPVKIKGIDPKSKKSRILFEGWVSGVPFLLSNRKFDEDDEPFEIVKNELVITVEWTSEE